LIEDARVRANLQHATAEFMAAMKSRPDDWATHANLGNYYMESRDFPSAAACFEKATALEPRQIGPMVNASMAYNNLGQNDKAEASLHRALTMEPNNAAANFNLALLLGEGGRLQEAEEALRTALEADPQMAPAAYNLAVILSKKSLDDAIAWCQKAHQLRPRNPKYAHTLAFYLRQKGDIESAIRLLREVIRHDPHYWDSYLLLGDIYEDRHDSLAATAIYRNALRVDGVPLVLRQQIEKKIHAAESQRRAE
jgi:Flp pilus assembly protein TadD